MFSKYKDLVDLKYDDFTEYTEIQKTWDIDSDVDFWIWDSRYVRRKWAF